MATIWDTLVVLPPIMSPDFAGGSVTSDDGGSTLFSWGGTPTTTGGKETYRTVNATSGVVTDEWEGTNNNALLPFPSPISSDNANLYIVNTQNSSLGGGPLFAGSVTAVDLLGESESVPLRLGNGAEAAAISADDSLLCITTNVPDGVAAATPGVAQLAKVSATSPPVLLDEVATGTQLHATTLSDVTKAMVFTPDGATVVAVASRDIYTVDVSTWAVTNRLIYTDGAWPVSSNERMTGGLVLSEDGATAYVVMADASTQEARIIDFDVATLTPGAIDYVVATDGDEKSANFTAATFLLRFSADADYMFVFYTDAGNNPDGEATLKVILMADGTEIVDVPFGPGVMFPGGVVPNQMFVADTDNDFWWFSTRPFIGGDDFANTRWFHIGPAAEPPIVQYQRIYGWRAQIDDNALETIDPVLLSPQGFTE